MATQHTSDISAGPQIGYAAVMEDGTVYVSRERRPVLALADISGQISRNNADRYAVGKSAHEGPHHVGQLHPYYQNANPDIQQLLDGLCPKRQVSCTSRAPAPADNRPARRKLPSVPPTNYYESGLGWTERVA